ncbi:type II 3-dehydroquinate dehydratase [Wenzhouxiangella sediminis]|uniref:3-dehydroquinate dehydratase n=1 Tax=Wenzhouxiangella sediminis TaxID=1792836 RepID=A0A3E1K9F6_9GAMM|nr:type II 3-dehydroquinate dehydratase [Wenzhouxiangella sediminis]RFF30634.1 type II 3-dehydroquinate dehydratase [Wenzhouxiangella sediminis]
MSAVLVVHGPNLNLLGRREPEVYGADTLADINARLARLAARNDVDLETFQSNAEHELVERIQATADDGTDWILINPAAFTHTSVAIRDALAAVALPFIEIHLSNPHRREPFRHRSHFSDLAEGVVAGLGADSYLLALQAVINKINASG